MYHFLFIVVAAEMALLLVLLFDSPLRKLVIKLFDMMKKGTGPIISKTVAATLFVVFVSLSYNVVEIHKRALEAGVLNPTEEVLMANRLLEASLTGFALFLAFVTYRLHNFMIKEIYPKRRLEADHDIRLKPDGLKEHSRKATASKSTSDVRT